MSQYMAVLLISGFFPLVFSFYPRLHFYRYWRALASSIAIVLVSFGLWDIVATWRGHWYFDERAVSSVWIFNLPLEEVLFFVVIPFCCIFSWEVVLFFKRKLQ